MKKILLLFSVVLTYFINAQVSSYTFVQSTGTYTPIAEPTILGTASESNYFLDNEVYSIAIPFDFSFNGSAFSSLFVSTNGFITFSVDSPDSLLTNPISDDTIFSGGVVSAFGADLNSVFNLNGVTGSVSWAVEGTSPNREIVIQWSDFSPAYGYSTTEAYTFSFQVRLKETTNSIAIVYKGGAFLSDSFPVYGYAQIGLRGSTNDDFNNRTNVMSELFSNSTQGITNDDNQEFDALSTTPGMPTNGLTYTWSTPVCFSPSGLTSSEMTATSAVVSWTAPSTGSPIGYDIYYTTLPEVPTAETTPLQTITSGTSVTLDSLTPSSTNYIWVRTRCSDTNQSDWISVSVVTSCLSITNLPWIENFDSMNNIGSGIVPACWKQITGTSAWSSADSSSGSYNMPRSNPNYMRVRYSNINPSQLWTPGFDLTAGTTYEFSFYYNTNGTSNNYIGFTGSVLVNTSQTAVGAINQGDFITATQGTENYTLHKIYYTPSSSGIYYFGLNVSSTSAPWYLGVDDFKLQVAPACIEPAQLAVATATTTSATISWAVPDVLPANGYEIYYSTTTTPPTIPQITGISSTSNSHTITGLNESTTYYIWLKALCSNVEQSPLAGPISVYTNYCVPTAGAFSTNYYLKKITTTGGWTNLNYTANSFSEYVNSNMPLLSSPGNSIVMNLESSGTYINRYYVWVDWNNDMDFNDPGEAILAGDSSLATAIATIPIPLGQPLGNYRVRTSTSVSWGAANVPCGPASYGNYVDFTLAVVAPPTCLPPTGLTVTGITGNSATLSWIPQTPLPSGGYEYFVSTSPAPPTGQPTGVVTGTENTITLPENLSPTTTYYWWVRAVCSSTDKSYLSQGPTFITSQIPATLPYVQDFTTSNDLALLNENYTNRWVYGSATGNTAPSLYISNDNGVSNAYSVSTSSAEVVHAFRDILIPDQTTIATLSFDWRSKGESGYDYLRVWLLPSNVSIAAGNQIEAGSGRIQVGQYESQDSWQSYSNTNLNLSAFAGSVMRLVFEWRNDSGGGAQPPAAIDNIVLRVCNTESPLVTVNNNSITHNSATISWSQDNGGASYKVKYRPTGTTEWLPTSGPIGVAAVTETTNSFQLQNLSPYTSYEVEVAAVCNVNNIGAYSHNEFTTKCDPTPPSIDISNITSISALVTWNPIAIGATYELRWREVGAETWNPANPSTPQPPANTYTLTGLSSYKTYEVQLRNMCNGSTTPNPWSTSKVFTTERICEIAPPGLTIVQLTPTTAEVVWDAYTGSGATNNYILRYRKVGIPSWTNISLSTNTYTITELLELTKYEMQVANVCGDTSGNYTPPYFFTTPTVVYCPMQSENSSTNYISKVTVTPNNKPQMVNDSSGSTYSDFTLDSLKFIEMIQGSVDNQIVVDKTMTSGSGAGVAVWIDFDRSGTFDLDERILAEGPNASPTASATFSVPTHSHIGSAGKYVVMRVAMSKDGIPVNCTNFEDGEVEDYAVRISKLPVDNSIDQDGILIYPNPVKSILTIKNISKKGNYKIYNAVGQLISSGIILNNKVDVSRLSSGVYIIDIDDIQGKAQKKFIKE